MMKVGANYAWPWNCYGNYFGNPDLGAWTGTLEDNLGRLSDLGIGVVRVFLLGNGWSYGQLQGKAFAPPDALPAAFADQFERMLVAFQNRKMTCIPSVLDFKALQSPPGVKGQGGRGAIATDAAVRDHFYGGLLEPLLSIADRYPDSLFAVEAMNEPVWTALDPFTPMRGAVKTFLEGAIARIAAHGHPSTVGHRFASDLDDLPTGSLRQFHYYPRTGLKAFLPLTEQPLPNHEKTRAILGEFSARSDGSQGDDWPDLDSELQRDPRRRVFERLRCAEAKGYELALVWPDLEGAPFGPADPLKLSTDAQAGIRDFIGATGPAVA
jgi:hypothetical protein